MFEGNFTPRKWPAVITLESEMKYGHILIIGGKGIKYDQTDMHLLKLVTYPPIKETELVMEDTGKEFNNCNMPIYYEKGAVGHELLYGSGSDHKIYSMKVTEGLHKTVMEPFKYKW